MPTNESRIGRSQARAKTEYKRRMESIVHTRILGEHKGMSTALVLCDFLTIEEVAENEIGWRCQFCGRMSDLEVHHREFRSHSGADSEENLITLCSECHARVHHGLEIKR